ncbi:hypothetical protein [Fodinicola feengrottensis]|uniref:Uncharacterized protein n=1 Tax=Fodinicola feengrottensis TaxID=435914 RepID=A0ABP4TL57_9ACTN|nr:hypothetical protein [Fodinicola feengrottensis]
MSWTPWIVLGIVCTALLVVGVMNNRTNKPGLLMRAAWVLSLVVLAASVVIGIVLAVVYFVS